MAKLSTDELLDAFKEMTLLELSDFVKKFEETFEVTAAATSPASPVSRSLGSPHRRPRSPHGQAPPRAPHRGPRRSSGGLQLG